MGTATSEYGTPRARRAFVLVLAATLGLAALAPAVAQAVDEPGGGDGEEAPGGEPAPDGQDPAASGGEPLEIEASALYVSPMTNAIPPTVRRQVPPEAVCVVFPEACPEASEPVRQGIVQALRELNENEPAFPVQPVPPDTAAVSFLGGHTRYQTAIRFAAPPVPDGQEVLEFTVTIPQSEPSYEIGSPAFRRAVLAAFETIGPQDPAVFAEGMAAALDEDPVELDPEAIGIEACPLLSPFEEGGAPQAADAEELPHREEGDERILDVDCILGTSAIRAGEGLWSFDLSFAAAAWAEGEIENHGILLRPIGAPNLAFGDPDTSTNAQVALDLTAVTASFQAAEAAPPVDGLGDADGFSDPEVADGAGGFDDGDGGFGDGGGDGGFGDGGGGFDDGGGGDLADGGEFDEAEFAEGEAPGEAEVADPQAAPGQEGTLAAGEGGPSMPWYVWLLVPVFLGGAYFTSQALTGGVAAAAGGGSAAFGTGAFSRLMARRGDTTV